MLPEPKIAPGPLARYQKGKLLLRGLNGAVPGADYPGMQDSSYKSEKWHSPELKCRNCKQHGLRRERKNGFFQMYFFPRLGYFPWECVFCRRISLYRRRFPAAMAEPVETSDSQLSY